MSLNQQKEAEISTETTNKSPELIVYSRKNQTQRKKNKALQQ